MTSKKKLLYGLLAVLVTIGFWLGGYLHFVNSDEWILAKKAISASEIVTSDVGQVSEVTVSPLGFSYRFSGEWGQAKLRLLVRGDRGEAKYSAELEKTHDNWTLVRVEKKK